MSQAYVQTFQCPKCREYINLSAKQCRFCGAEVDSRAAAADAQLQAKVAQAVNLARVAQALVWSMPLFWANVVLFYAIGTETGFFITIPVVLFASTAGAMFEWWRRFGDLRTDDVDYARARESMKGHVVLFGFLFFVPQVLLLVAWAFGLLDTVLKAIGLS